MRRVLWQPGVKPDNKVSITRRIFLNRALLAGTAAGAAAAGWLPRINTLDMAFAQTGGATETFKFAWISDTHLYPRDVNTRFVEKAVRAVKEVQAMRPAGRLHDLRRRPRPARRPGRARARRRDHQGARHPEALHPRRARLVPRHGRDVARAVRRVALDLRPQGRPLHRSRTVSRARTTGPRKKMTPEERMGAWPRSTAARRRLGGRGPRAARVARQHPVDWPKDKPGRDLQPQAALRVLPALELLGARLARGAGDPEAVQKVTNIHGHTHQLLYNGIGNMRSTACWRPRGPGRTPPRACPR